MRAIIVEDNPEMRMGFKELVKEHCPNVEVEGSAGSVVEAAKLAKEIRPELIFLDIELPDGSGFDLLDIIDTPVRVIFTTGSDGHAIRAFRYAAVDYLLKPIAPGELKDAVRRAAEKGPVEGEQFDILTGKFDADSTPEKIALHTSDKIAFIPLKDIVRCNSDGNYTRFFIKGQSPILVAKTLKEYDKLLSPSHFLRVHQSHLVNVNEILEFVKTDGGYLVLSDGEKVPVSTRKKSDVLNALEGLGI